MAPIEKGTKLTDNPRKNRMQVRLTQMEAEELGALARELNLNKTAVLMQGLRLVALQKKNLEFHNLSDYLILHELEQKEPLSKEEKKGVIIRAEMLKKKI